MGKIIHNMRLSLKINLIVISNLLVFGFAIYLIIQQDVVSGIKDVAIEKARSDLAMGYEIIDIRHPGPWKIVDEQLFKGDTLINNNTDIVDKIVALSGGTATIFLGDTRVTTTVVVNGERAVGTKASDTVVETALVNGDTYFGEANVLGSSIQTAYKPLKDSTGEIIGMWYVGVSQEYIDDTIGSILIVLLSAIGGMIFITTIVVFVFSARLKKRLKNITTALKKAGQGDFSETLIINSGDEIGELSEGYNEMKSSLHKLLLQITEMSEQVAASSEQLSASADETSKATESIASSIQEVAVGSEKQVESTGKLSREVSEISRGLQQISNNVDQVKNSALTTSVKSNDGSQLITNVVKQMNVINDKANATFNSIQDLKQKSDEIGKIIKLITEVADQTNLLSLNAAIEAARAGEQGKGFAVVANEVRKLAEQSRVSAGQISSLINDIQAGVQDSARNMNEGKLSVDVGLGLVDKAGLSFDEISFAINDVSAQVQEVASAVEQIKGSGESMILAVEDTSRVAEESAGYTQNVAAAAEEQAASMEEITSSAEVLSQMAEELQQAVRKFQV
ncbi:methyl-accepting chemotaxis protein [Evansella sp. AB-rgal1]|uniref:methyl-accepting chemotaxis protein n=1 Tax=Evansella sp. AB-rgal1 TaxID=3242696 RepID=UPI00359EDE93